MQKEHIHGQAAQTYAASRCAHPNNLHAYLWMFANTV